MWNYEEAFKRNLGLITAEEQQRLRRSRVAIMGMGGVGGVHLVTLARIGIGNFTIADPDQFETANTNRQYGAFVSTEGQNKAEVMARIVRDINPEADVRILPGAVGAGNVDAFLQEADLLVDGIDAFAIDVRRFVFSEARKRGLYTLTAGPFGFTTAWVTFSPSGMSFDRYFDFRDDQDEVEKVAAFMVGLVPKATHLKYQDTTHMSMTEKTGPSSAAACQLCAGLIGIQAIQALLGRSGLRAAPHYFQFDAYRQKLVKGYLWGGNRHPLQRIKRAWFTHFLRSRTRRPA